MEKAHPGVHDVFYQIFDKGEIADSEGRRIDFRNTIIIMTSNAADSAVVQACAEALALYPKRDNKWKLGFAQLIINRNK